MKISGKHYRTIWPRDPRESGDGGVEIIDQTKLPHRFETRTLRDVDDAAHAIKAMIVRGAPLIGATAAYGMALAMREDASDEGARPRPRSPACDAADGGQSALGAEAHARSPAQPTARGTCGAGLGRSRAHCRRRRRDLPRHRRAWSQDPARGSGEEERQDAQRAHPLQRRLARLRRLGHGAGAALYGA